MNLLRLAAQIFLIYLVYKFIVNVIIPVYQSSKQIKKQFGTMKENMQNMQQGNYNSQTPPVNKTQPASVPPEKEGDYIEFEEVK